MNLLRCILLLQFATTPAFGHAAHLASAPGLHNSPGSLVRSLYTEVVSRRPHDIPQGAEMKIFAPYLSKALLHKIDIAKACSNDWSRRIPESHLKAEMDSKFGLFYGVRWSAEPQTFKIARIQSEKEGFSRVDVNLTSGGSPARRYMWDIEAIVLREDGHSVVDDVIYINNATYDYPEDKPADRRLSEYLAAGCDGPRWIGYSLPNQPEALIHSLYEQVVAHTPVGIPSGIDWKIFAPYMSKTLLHRIDDFNGCVDDWDRRPQDPRYPQKPPFGVFESGIFSGGDELSGPRTFNVERRETQNDGSVRV